MTIPLFFSTPDYYKNLHFQRCMRNWNKYLSYEPDYHEDEDKLMAEWEEILLKDFLKHAREWLKRNYDMIHWKVGLE